MINSKSAPLMGFMKWAIGVVVTLCSAGFMFGGWGALLALGLILWSEAVWG